ncbi:hypothetical protein EYZ11_009526 [Aspergillus tanneri]|nr:hypothetical protein EYZ11_009526 [Aspergillus tanneri]
MDLKANNITIGNATINNLVLRPGNHSTSLQGVVDIHQILDNLSPILQSQRESLRNGRLSLDAVTREVIYNGRVIPYYTEVMRDLVLSAKVPISDLLTNSVEGFLHKNGSEIRSILNKIGNGRS